MSVAETGQMSAAETGQMSAVETRQMSSVARTYIYLVPTHNVDVSEVGTVSMSQCSSDGHLNSPNTTMFKAQTSQLSQYHNFQVSEVSIVQDADRRSGPKSTKMVRNGSRMVARS